MRGARTWIVAADGGVVRVFERLAPGGEVAELIARAMKAPAAPKPPSRAPRVHDRMGPARHAIEKRVAPRVAAENHFLEHAAKQLSAWAGEGAYDELILCAPPRVAGVLKAHLDTVVGKRLRSVVLKDLTHEGADQIAARLEAGFS